MIIIVGSCSYKIVSDDYNERKPIDPVKEAEAAERERLKRATDTRVTTLGGKQMTYNFYLSFSSLPDKLSYPNDKIRSIIYEVRIDYDGSLVLWDPLIDPNPSKTTPPGIWAMVSLNAIKPRKNGYRIHQWYKEAMNNKYTYCRPAENKFGLKRCIEKLKNGNEGSDYQEYLVTMKDDVTPLRFFDVSIPRYLIGTGKGGIVKEHFMYDDKIQVRIAYSKKELKNWKLIEESVINYINERIKEAENVKKIHYSDTSNAITRNCP